MTHRYWFDHVLHFDIDATLNPWLPASILPRLPFVIKYPLGYRQNPVPSLPATLHTLVSVVATFLGVLCVTAVFNFSPQLQHISSPVLIPSLGAGAVLNYVTPNLPAAQPRPTILGQTISATVGVAIAKAFSHAQEPFESLMWLSVPLAVSAAVLAMRLTNTVHPPGGATAALAIVTANTRALGWWLVASVAIGTSVMVGVGLVVNNVGRRWPEFWWSAGEMGARWKESSHGEEGAGSKDEKRSMEQASDGGSTLAKLRSGDTENGDVDGVCHCCGR